MNTDAPSYHGYRFPPEIISHAVWLYHRFCLSFRDVEDLLAERGITVTYETVRQWCRKFGPEFARRLKRRQGRLGDTWHLDELFVTIQGRRHYLWRAAERFFRMLLKGQGREPRRLVTDKLRSYVAAQRTVMPSVVHDTGRYKNNRAEVQVVCSSPAILVGARNHPESLPCRTTPVAGSQPANASGSRLPCLERGNLCLTNRESMPTGSQRSSLAKLTEPLDPIS